MCPPGYHHNGIMAARELGHTMYGYSTVGLHCGVTRVLKLRAVSDAYIYTYILMSGRKDESKWY